MTLQRTKYTKEEAIDQVQALNAHLLSTNPAHKMSVQCINSHIIYAAEWELEVVLSLTPGI